MTARFDDRSAVQDSRSPPSASAAGAIGGWMWGPQDDQDSIGALHAAVDEGVTVADDQVAAVNGITARLRRDLDALPAVCDRHVRTAPTRTKEQPLS